MAPNRRISIGYAANNNDDNEWHQKIRDILDIGTTGIDVKTKTKSKRGPARRRTISSHDARVSPVSAKVDDPAKDVNDESTASLSWGSNAKDHGTNDDRFGTSVSCLSVMNMDIYPVSSPVRSPSVDEMLESVVPAKDEEHHQIYTNSPSQRSTHSNSAGSSSPFAETKHTLLEIPSFKDCMTTSQKSRVDVGSRRRSSDTGYPEVPFTFPKPIKHHISNNARSSRGEDDLQSSLQTENSCLDKADREFNFSNKDCQKERNVPNMRYFRRSSCGDTPSHFNSPKRHEVHHNLVSNMNKCYTSSPPKAYRQNMTRRASYCNDSPPSIHNESVLQSPLLTSTPKTQKPFSIKVQRRSSCGESSTTFNVPLPFTANSASTEPPPFRRSSHTTSGAPPTSRQSMFHHPQPNQCDTCQKGIDPVEMKMDKTTRRCSNNDSHKPLQRVKPRRRASTSFETSYEVRESGGEDCNRPPIPFLVCKMKNNRSNSMGLS